MPRHLVRYEDLRRQPIAELTRIVRFLLPDVDLDTDPIVNRKSIACATRPDPALEPYRPRRIANFASWDDYTPAARRVLLDKSALWWCKCVSSAWATTLTLADSATRSWRRPRACSRGSTAMRSRGQTRRRWTRRAARRHCTLYHYAHAQSSLVPRLVETICTLSRAGEQRLPVRRSTSCTPSQRGPVIDRRTRHRQSTAPSSCRPRPASTAAQSRSMSRATRRRRCRAAAYPG